MSDKINDVQHVVKWGQVQYNLHDIYGRLKRSDFNYFFKDREHGVIAGYWEAENGVEELGSADDFHELILVLDGNLYVQPDGQEDEIVASKGDTVVVVKGRKIRLIVREPVKAFFVCYPLKDIDGYETMCKAKK